MIDIEVSGPATAEDLAAILAALRARKPSAVVAASPYQRWRRQRQAVLRDNR